MVVASERPFGIRLGTAERIGQFRQALCAEQNEEQQEQMLNSRGPNPPTMVLPRLALALPVVEAFPPKVSSRRLTTANRGKEGDFSTLDEVVHRTPLAVERHGQTKRNPFFQPEVENKFRTVHPSGTVCSCCRPPSCSAIWPKAMTETVMTESSASMQRLRAGIYEYNSTSSIMPPALEASQLWKLYQAGESTVEAVRGVDVRIDSGEMIAVMGPSGCGKTTLLNILSGIDEPTSGTVSVNGQPLYGISDDQRTDLRSQHFGFIFQNFNLLPVLSAVENVELPLLLNGRSPGEARSEAQAPSSRSALATVAATGLRNFLAGSSNASPLPGQSFTDLRSFFATNPPGTWTTPRPVKSCASEHHERRAGYHLPHRHPRPSHCSTMSTNHHDERWQHR